MQKISVIMASYLGDYPNAASNRKSKFIRAVNSFADQSYQNKELIIVSDGCQDTIDLIRSLEMKTAPIQLVTALKKGQLLILQKQSPFSGFIRNQGIKSATGEIICYLDTDDVFLPGHLRNIAEAFSGGIMPDWIYMDDFVAESADLSNKRRRHSILSEGRIGTSCIAHRKILGPNWSDDYGHDWRFIDFLQTKFYNYQRSESAGYLVCHIPGQLDF